MGSWHLPPHYPSTKKKTISFLLISFKELLVAWPSVSLFSLHRCSKGDALWRVTKHRDPTVAHQFPVFSVISVPILQVFLMMLRRVPQQAGPEPTKMRNSFHDASINIWFLPRRGHVPLHYRCKKEWEFFRWHVLECIKCYTFFFNYLILVLFSDLEA